MARETKPKAKVERLATDCASPSKLFEEKFSRSFAKHVQEIEPKAKIDWEHATAEYLSKINVGVNLRIFNGENRNWFSLFFCDC